MSLFNRFVFAVLVVELVVYLLTLLPLNFIAVKTRRKVMQTLSRLGHNEYILWTSRLSFMIVFVVFADTINRLFHQESKQETTINSMASAMNVGDYRHHLADIKSQRNMYLSLFAMFMMLVIYRRAADMYQMLVFQEEISDMANKLKLMTSQTETLTMAAAKGSEVKEAPPKTTETLIASDSQSGGARKRNTFSSTKD